MLVPCSRPGKGLNAGGKQDFRLVTPAAIGRHPAVTFPYSCRTESVLAARDTHLLLISCIQVLGGHAYHSGVTSSGRTSLTSPLITPACTAAPTATVLWPELMSGSLPPVSDVTRSTTAGIRVDPPTSSTLFRSWTLIPASLITCWNGPLHRSSRSAVIRSNSARVSRACRCSGPSAIAGRFTCA